MGAMRFLPALLLVVLLGGPILFLSNPAYAGPCMCDQACPQPSCYCNTRCAVTDSSQKDIFESSTIQVRSLRNSVELANDNSENGFRSGFTLVAIPQGFVRLQCQRLKEMLNWAGDFQDGTSAFRQIFVQ